jgi:hypothetical protein
VSVDEHGLQREAEAMAMVTRRTLTVTSRQL